MPAGMCIVAFAGYAATGCESPLPPEGNTMTD